MTRFHCSRLGRWLWLLLLCLCLPWQVAAADDFLPPEQAFKMQAQAADDKTVELRFTAAPGYYLYREQFKFSADDARLGAPQLPPGKIKYDETFQRNVETYKGDVRIRVPVEQGPSEFRLQVMSQGCADAGLCYPPMPTTVQVRLRGFGGDGTVQVISHGEAPMTGLLSRQLGSVSRPAAPAVSPATPSGGGEGALTDALQGRHLWRTAAVFLGFGVLLAFTPCVLPMLPILSSIIVGQGGSPLTSRWRGLGLAASYSLGMATIYTALGMAAGLAGEGLAAYLQTPLVLGGFALLLVVLSLSMFGVYELRLPSGLTSRVAGASQRLPGSRLLAVFAMGGLSALIVSPCVAAPLATALVYISQTRDVWLGGIALFALAAGMSVPLLLMGASAGALLPRAGPWMEGVKRFFGVLLLAVAWWMVQPVVPATLGLAGWGALAMLAAVLLWTTAAPGSPPSMGQAVGRTMAAVLTVFALLQAIGAASGGTDPLLPLAHLRGAPASRAAALPFRPLKTVAELDGVLASAGGKTVVLDFYADWCVSCKEMERFTFSDPAVQQRLNQAVLLKADVTANDANDRELLKRFGLFGPPAMLFFDGQGRELAGLRVVGFQDAGRFGQTLDAAGL